MHAEFWDVGGPKTALPMTAGDISAHLLADRFPSLPVAASTGLIGWPPFITELVDYEALPHLTLRSIAGKTERQWKGVLSWMLGVAGTRMVLSNGGYQWIA